MTEHRSTSVMRQQPPFVEAAMAVPSSKFPLERSRLRTLYDRHHLQRGLLFRGLFSWRFLRRRLPLRRFR